ncbi:hypothetical protein H6G89_17125 [Oscillatoria sp. FACHB-1407]|uniref:hypothetical protein n=1 Tax=Oscillatoria sp. FACHB-1407 TaxID=2692847 RepID=UPI00168605F6|nr:hypothetical protein [Oscillatoria sp. FACHB-1407]MBD2462765.1 hypothetical protein [Oscillatoria sp. FACHB-1407]
MDNEETRGEIDRLPVSALMERYTLVRSAVYTRLEALGIKPEKVGNKSFLNAQQIELMDDLHRFIQSGGTTAEFLDSRGISKAGESSGLSLGQSSGSSSGLSTVPSSDMMQMFNAFADAVSRLQPAAPPPDPLAYFRHLEEAAQNGWILKTSEVAYLLDLLPSEISQYGDAFSDAGFVFTRSGYRGGEVAWRVSKPIK